MKFWPGITFFLTVRLCAGAPTDWIAQLHSPEIEVRRAAVDRIQTLDDARIPEACLPLLQDEGLSIRRQAARAIGSRSYEIPKRRLPEFLAALRQYRDTAPDDDRTVAERALGLLSEDFSGPAFCVSPDKKWVLYEERRRPVIADTRLAKRQLLSPKVPLPDPFEFDDNTVVERGELVERPQVHSRLLKLMVTNETPASLFRPHWHPGSVALEIQPTIQRRFFAPICLWRSSDGSCRVFSVASFRSLYGKRFPHWATVMDFVKWQENKAIFKIYDCDVNDGEPYDPKGILVSVDIGSWKIAREKE